MHKQWDAETVAKITRDQRYLKVEGINWQVGENIVQDLDEIPQIRAQVARFKPALSLLGWKTAHVIIVLEGTPVVPLIPADANGLFADAQFPHERFAALLSAAEAIAKEIVNKNPPDESPPSQKPQVTQEKDAEKPRVEKEVVAPYSKGKKFPHVDGPSTQDLLATAGLSREAVEELLPGMALNSGTEVKLLFPGGSGSYKTIDLPKSESLRSPDQPVADAQLPRFEEEVLGFVPLHGLVMTNRNQWMSVTCEGAAPLLVGHRYTFVDTLKHTTFTKTVCHVRTDGKPIEECQQDAFSLSDQPLDPRRVEHVLRRLGIDPRRFDAEYQREEIV